MSIAQQKCHRCSDMVNGTIMSKFNTDEICWPCKTDEKQAPGYKRACEEEIAAVRSGVRNFPGVGLTEIDQTYLRVALTLRRSAETAGVAAIVRLQAAVGKIEDPAYALVRWQRMNADERTQTIEMDRLTTKAQQEDRHGPRN